eukprot:15452577-Alexandrium_andersonii.AAC.1
MPCAPRHATACLCVPPHATARHWHASACAGAPLCATARHCAPLHLRAGNTAGRAPGRRRDRPAGRYAPRNNAGPQAASSLAPPGAGA